MKITQRFPLITALVAAVICSGAPEAVAQTEPILGCVMPGTGLLRIPPSGQGCKAEETPLGFNDLPLLVALRTQVQQLQAAVASLEQRLASVEACTQSIPECTPE